MSLLIPFAPILLLSLFLSAQPATAETASSLLQQSVSETLDLWRDGQYDRLFERLSHRGKTSKEQFIARMRETAVRPACCWQKMENFKVMSEKRTEATVYVKVGMEGGPGVPEASTRDFKLSNVGGEWKMQLNDIFSLAGITGKKNKRAIHKKNHK
jgi:hypothetical protein